MAAQAHTTPEHARATALAELAALIELQRQTAALEMAELMELVEC